MRGKKLTTNRNSLRYYWRFQFRSLSEEGEEKVERMSPRHLVRVLIGEDDEKPYR
jgi:hypothetical protein